MGRAPHMLYCPELPRRRAPDLEAMVRAVALVLNRQGCQDICRQLFRALADEFAARRVFWGPTQWIAACTACTQPSLTSPHCRVLHQPLPDLSRAPRSALPTRHSTVQGCCAAKTQETTRRRPRMLQGKHRPGLCPLSNKDLESRTDRPPAFSISSKMAA
jgi:hypothetical protein